MKVFETIAGIKEHIKKQKANGRSVGFVPTMGALHRGHTSLVQKARNENDLVVCSIFVNPKQFNNPQDLERYPRNINQDLQMLSNVGCDIVFSPSKNEMYPKPTKENFCFGELEETMEGKYRKGHFAGVAIVVKKLLKIVEPDRAYFGKKDYQQLLIVKKLVQTTGLPVKIVPCDTVREVDGLALSSRNERLSPQQRTDAATIFQTLTKSRKLYPETSIEKLKEIVANDINSKPTLKLEYFEIVNPENLQPLKTANSTQKAIACIAVYAGDIRLIDNMVFND